MGMWKPFLVSFLIPSATLVIGWCQAVADLDVPVSDPYLDSHGRTLFAPTGWGFTIGSQIYIYAFRKKSQTEFFISSILNIFV